MDIGLLHALMSCETDVDGALDRFSGDEELYAACLDSFLQDMTMFELSEAIKNEQWDDAFTAAHALKGLAGNMGFIPLYHATGELVVTIRAGRVGEITSCYQRLSRSYQEIVDAIKRNRYTA